MDGLDIPSLAAPGGVEPLTALDELLPEAPVEAVAVVDVVCPACGAEDPAVQQVEDAEVAKCGQCGCEYCPDGIHESTSRFALLAMSAQRRRRFESLNAVDIRESLPANTSGHAFLLLDR